MGIEKPDRRDPGVKRDPHPVTRALDEPVSRREVLRRAGFAVGATVTPRVVALARNAETLANTGTLQQDELPRTLSQNEYEMLDAACSRLIPTDANGPGAHEAMAVRYIDRALGGALAASRDEYAQGLAALDRHAQAAKGARFVELDAADQDDVLTDVQEGRAEGFPPGFFNTLRTHTIQGTFSDPFYGGNAGFIGWDMIGYPGVRVAVAAEYQEIGVPHPANHVSVYDAPMFEPGED